jgi:hypothetical protein
VRNPVRKDCRLGRDFVRSKQNGKMSDWVPNKVNITGRIVDLYECFYVGVNSREECGVVGIS